ncbi:MAG: hypothetical protein FJ088_14920, partial [Deltaproteobacteria bacterium]|nr:hypothetical protein [Deltaproteobacteria bacterium]
MKKAVQILILFGMLSGASEAQETKSGAGRKDMYVFIVAASESGDPKQNSLKYADDDAALYYEFFKPVAKKANIFTVFDGESRGIFAEMANEALPPRKDIVLSEFRKMREEIRANGDANSALFIVLIGHGGIDEKGEGYLNLMGGRLARGEIKKEMIASAGDLVETTLIIDTCNAYFLVKSRDEWKFHDTGADLTEKFDEFLFNFERKNEFPILGLIVSTAGARETFEWEYLKAGVFSHVVRSGLHGGADINQDKKVTYSELRAFIASVTGGVKNEKAKIKYFIEAPSGYDDKVIVDLSAWEEKGADLLVLSKEGRYFLEDNRGVRVFDLNAGSGAVFPLLLPKKLAYYLNLNGLETKINTPAGWEKGIDNLAFAESAAAK